ncbi:MAG TPA: transposase [Verrucomicrobiae bacterium]|jgi:REP element-mobilizing transposase RayT|nr:transposase [Verrucomicrobiae bacterium]
MRDYLGAVYHVMARGTQGQAIFADDQDRKRFLETLAEACQRTGWLVRAYVLMGNHYHLLIETPEGNLVAGMKWLQSAYTQRYNRRRKLFGHLFQGRYKAVIVDEREPMYFQVLSTYIHLNPVRAGLVRVGQQRLKGYKWSSYRWYLVRRGKAPFCLERRRVMGSLRLRPADRRGYEASIEGRVLELGMKTGRKELEQSWKAIRRGWYLGEPSFLDKLEAWLERTVKGRYRQSHSGAARGSARRSCSQSFQSRLKETFGGPCRCAGLLNACKWGNRCTRGACSPPFIRTARN